MDMRIKTPVYTLIASVILLLIVIAGLVVYFIPPGKLFDFNKGKDQGWKLDGVYCGDQSTQLQALSGPPVWQDHSDAATTPLQDPAGNGKGSVAFPLMGFAGCTAACPWWRIDLLSPDLGSRSEWQDIKGYSAKLADKASVAPKITQVQAQLLLRVRKPDGSITFLREVDAAGQAVFCPLTDNWGKCTAAIDSTGYTVLNLVVRVLGTCVKNDLGVLEGGIYLDDVQGND